MSDTKQIDPKVLASLAGLACDVCNASAGYQPRPANHLVATLAVLVKAGRHAPDPEALAMGAVSAFGAEQDGARRWRSFVEAVLAGSDAGSLGAALRAERERAERLEREVEKLSAGPNATAAELVARRKACERERAAKLEARADADRYRAALVGLTKASGEVLGEWDVTGELTGPMDALRAARSLACDALPLPPCTCHADPEGVCLGCVEAGEQGRDPAAEAEAAAYAAGAETLPPAPGEAESATKGEVRG